MDATSRNYGEVKLPLYMAVTELTYGEYAVGTGTVAPLKGADTPRGSVTVTEAMDFCNLLSQKEALQPAYDSRSGNNRLVATDGYRLVSTVEGEFAALGGRDVTWKPTPAEWNAVAWYGENSDRKIHPVGLKEPSPFGIYDLYGNVWEWDTEHGQFRGMHFGQPAAKMQVCGERFTNGTKYRAPDVGFRLALPINATTVPIVRAVATQNSGEHTEGEPNDSEWLVDEDCSKPGSDTLLKPSIRGAIRHGFDNETYFISLPAGQKVWSGIKLPEAEDFELQLTARFAGDNRNGRLSIGARDSAKSMGEDFIFWEITQSEIWLTRQKANAADVILWNNPLSGRLREDWNDVRIKTVGASTELLINGILIHRHTLGDSTYITGSSPIYVNFVSDPSSPSRLELARVRLKDLTKPVQEVVPLHP